MSSDPISSQIMWQNLSPTEGDPTEEKNIHPMRNKPHNQPVALAAQPSHVPCKFIIDSYSLLFFSFPIDGYLLSKKIHRLWTHLPFPDPRNGFLHVLRPLEIAPAWLRRTISFSLFSSSERQLLHLIFQNSGCCCTTQCHYVGEDLHSIQKHGGEIG